jgi:LCP family protein required for cell wall assembly
VPGTGQLYAGALRRGYLLVGISAAIFLAALTLAAARPLDSLLSVDGLRLLLAVLLVNAALLAFRLFSILDAWRWGPGQVTTLTGLVLVALLFVAAAPHVAAGYVAIRAYDVANTVFADDEPRDVLPASGIFLATAPVRDADDELPRPLAEKPVRAPRIESRPLPGVRRVFLASKEPLEHRWVTILLLGSDNGPRQAGDRTDTMIVVALQRDTGRAVAFGVPRNLGNVPLGGAAAASVPRFPWMLNALYGWAARTRPDLFPGGRDPGATALKQAISTLLGIRVDYYAMVNLDGFVDVVDALGGVRIHVKERLVDEVTRPAWGETKPRIDVYPGRVYRFTGRTALAYVRSRKASSDYRRMARQRCFLSALADQLDARSVFRHFTSLAATVEKSVRTDIPLNRVPDLVRTVTAVETGDTLTETFGPEYFAGRTSEQYPIPNLGKIRASVRDAILNPERARQYHGLPSVQQAC